MSEKRSPDVPQKPTAGVAPAPPRGVSRRTFTRGVAATFGAAAGFHFFPSLANKRLEKPTLAGIGVGGKGRADINGSAAAGFEVISLVDVIDAKRVERLEGRLRRMGAVREAYPDATFFTDYREMLADLGDKVDAVTVSTPDHHHFHASALAMKAGKHVYCQKPLTHGTWEARKLAEIARQTGVQTQMGNQAHANDHLRRCVELIRGGAVGKVESIHAWTNRPIWPQGFAAPPPTEPVPEGIDWEQWVGPAPWTDYSSRIAPFAWRGWWDYGTGALGDMACHIMDLGYWAVGPVAPQSVIAEQHGATALSPPINSKITWQFPASDLSGPDGFRFRWYDGYVDATFDRDNWQLKKQGNEYNHPDAEVLDGEDFTKFGSVVIGSEGKLFFHRQRDQWVLRRDTPFDTDAVPTSIPRARDRNNYREWIDAIEGRVEHGESHFALAGPLTETVLLGVLAQRFPDTELRWDADKLEVTGRPECSPHIRREYREGWQIDV